MTVSRREALAGVGLADRSDGDLLRQRRRRAMKGWRMSVNSQVRSSASARPPRSLPEMRTGQSWPRWFALARLPTRMRVRRRCAGIHPAIGPLEPVTPTGAAPAGRPLRVGPTDPFRRRV